MCIRMSVGMIHGLNLYDHSRCLIAWSNIQIGGIPICTELCVGCNALRLSDRFKQGCTKWGTQAISKQYSVSSVGLKRTSPPQTKPNDPINCQISIFNWKLSNQYIGSLGFQQWTMTSPASRITCSVIYIVHPIKYAHGYAVLLFVLL